MIMVKNFLDKLSVLLATGGGSGFAPKAPGTFGSLAAVPLVWYAHDQQWTAIEMVYAIIVITIVGLWSTDRVEKLWHTHDDQRIVIDEVAGLFITLAWFPFTWFYVLIGFALFRLFDIWKPGPIGYIDEKVPGALGTFFDDVLAGFFAAGVLWIIHIISVGMLSTP
jgi:phosphatidylglycerophosphatase A